MPTSTGVTQAVQDLLWTVNTPSLVRGEQVADAAPVTAQEIDAERLAAFLAERPAHRVGRYFENLLHFWLVHVRGVDLVGASIQLRDGKRTIGELDFVYRDEANAVVHCEAAVKFFLHYSRTGTSHYPGPNASDNFEAKTNKLFDKQLRASEHYETPVDRREAFVRGMIFRHPAASPDQQPPVRLAPGHLHGAWMRSSELGALGERADVVGCVANKPFWLAPEFEAEVFALGALSNQLCDHFAAERDHPLMLSLRDSATLEEVERIFVVSTNWPN